mmetsp:Transcript_42630/g.66688  ORF Transcript_42630/g.66688 Transcript_42630/m.66688 type:complete len:454 (-) Transcript_42630:606-1967(-)
MSTTVNSSGSPIMPPYSQAQLSTWALHQAQLTPARSPLNLLLARPLAGLRLPRRAHEPHLRRGRRPFLLPPLGRLLLGKGSHPVLLLVGLLQLGLARCARSHAHSDVRVAERDGDGGVARRPHVRILGQSLGLAHLERVRLRVQAVRYDGRGQPPQQLEAVLLLHGDLVDHGVLDEGLPLQLLGHHFGHVRHSQPDAEHEEHEHVLEDDEAPQPLGHGHVLVPDVIHHERNERRVGHDREDVHDVEDGLPGADVLGRVGQRAPVLGHQLIGVRADLDPVVHQAQQRRQRQRGHEERHVPELQRQLAVVHQQAVHEVVLLPDVLLLGRAQLLLPRLVHQLLGLLGLQVRDQHLHNVAVRDLPAKDDDQVDEEQVDAGGVARQLPVVHVRALERGLDEGNVDEGRVRVHELENKELGNDRVLVLRVCAVVLIVVEVYGQAGVQLVQHLNLDRVHD